MSAGDPRTASTLERIAAAASGKSRPSDRDRGAPPAGPGRRDGDYDIRIARDGTWYHEGTPITRKPLVKLFSSVLRRDPDGTFRLVTPVESGTIVVEDAPFVAVAVEVSGEGPGRRLAFRTNVDDEIVAGPAHPIRVAVDPDTGEPRPYLSVRDGLEALIARPVFYELVELAEETVRDGVPALGIWSDGVFFDLGRLDGAP